MAEHPLMALLFEEQPMFVGGAEQIEDEVMPIPAQLNLGPGDTALMAGSDCPLERDSVIVRAVNPEDYAEQYPDWEVRMLKSYLLCEAFSREDPEVTVGWYSRLKLMPIAEERYDEAKGWLEQGWPSTIPDWMMGEFVEYTDRLSQNAPEVIPRSVRCDCQSRNTKIAVTKVVLYQGRAGVLNREGNELFCATEDPDIETKYVAQLLCTNCGRTAALTDGEWYMPQAVQD